MLQVECGWLQIKRKQQSSASGWNEPHPVSKIHNHTGQLQDGPQLGINEVIAPINGLKKKVTKVGFLTLQMEF